MVVKDTSGTKLAEWSGDQGEVTSDVLSAGEVTVHLFSDYSVTGWGVSLAGYDWR